MCDSLCMNLRIHQCCVTAVLATVFLYFKSSTTSFLAGLGDLRQTIGSVWRLAVMGDPLVRRYVVRDADSPVLQREVDAVREWLRSDKVAYISVFSSC